MNRKLSVLLMALLVPGGLLLGVQSAPAQNAAEKPTTSKYAGTENCRMCHSDVAESWDKSAHARSFELLVNVGKQKDPECLPCHTTGFGKGGYVDEATTPELKDTSCESCHGPGADHNGDATKIVRVPSGKTCAACHQTTDIHSMPSM